MSPITPPVVSASSTPTTRSRQASGQSSSSSSASSGLLGIGNTPPARSRRTSGNTPAPISMTADTMRQTRTLGALHDCLQPLQQAIVSGQTECIRSAATDLLSRRLHGRLLLDLQLPSPTSALEQASLQANRYWLQIVDGLVREGAMDATRVAQHLLYADPNGSPAPSTSCYAKHPGLAPAFMSLLELLERRGAIEIGTMRAMTQDRLRSRQGAAAVPGPSVEEGPPAPLLTLLAEACELTSPNAQAQLESSLIELAVQDAGPPLVAQPECEALQRAVLRTYAQEGPPALGSNPMFAGARLNARTALEQVRYALDVLKREMVNTRSPAARQIVDGVSREYVEMVGRNSSMGSVERGATLRRLTEAALDGIDQMLWLFQPPDVPAPATFMGSRSETPMLLEPDPADRSPVRTVRPLDLTAAELRPVDEAGSNQATLADVEGERWRVKATGSRPLSAMESTLAKLFQLTGLEAPNTALAGGLAVESGQLQTGTAASDASAHLFASRHDAEFVDLGRFLTSAPASALVAQAGPAQGEAYAELQRQHARVVAQQQALLEAAGAERPWFLQHAAQIDRHATLDAERFALLEAMNRMLPSALRDEAARHYIASHWLDNWDHLNYRMENFGYTLREGAWVGMTVDFGSCGPIGFRDLQTGQMQPKAESSDIARQQRPPALFRLPETAEPFDLLAEPPGALGDIHHWPYGAQSSSIAEHVRSEGQGGVVAEMGYRLYLIPDAALSALVERDWETEAAPGWPDARAMVDALNMRRNVIVDEIGVESVLTWMHAHPQAAARVRAQMSENLQRALGQHEGLAGFRQQIEQAHGALETMDAPPLPMDGQAEAPTASSEDTERVLQRVVNALQMVQREQRTEQVVHLAHALDEVCALAPGSSGMLLQPDVAGRIAAVLQRQQDLAQPDTTRQLARIAAASYERAVSERLECPGGAMAVADALAGGEHGWQTSALSETLVGRGRAALADWSQLILADVPARLQAADPDVDLSARAVQDDHGKRSTLKQALRNKAVDRGYVLKPARHGAAPQGAQDDETAAALNTGTAQGRAQALAIIREHAPAQIAADRERARELDRIAQSARRVSSLDLSPHYLRQQQAEQDQKARDRALSAASLARHLAAEDALYTSRQQESARRQQAGISRGVARTKAHGNRKRAEREAVGVANASTTRLIMGREEAVRRQQRQQRDDALRGQLDRAALARASQPTPAAAMPVVPPAPAQPAAPVAASPKPVRVAPAATAAVLSVQVTSEGHSVTVASSAGFVPPRRNGASLGESAASAMSPASDSGAARIRTLGDLERDGSLPALAAPTPRAAPTPVPVPTDYRTGTAAQAPLGRAGVRQFSAEARQRWNRDYYSRPPADAPLADAQGARHPSHDVAQRLGGAQDAAALQRARANLQRGPRSPEGGPPSAR